LQLLAILTVCAERLYHDWGRNADDPVAASCYVEKYVFK
jgi:hypothetical protein